MKKTVALHNLGCKVNAYETEAMSELLESAGYEMVSFTEPADVYVINTCSVTNIADKKSRQMLHRAKRKNPNSIVVAVGCYVQSQPEAVSQDPLVDIAIGNDRKTELVEILDAYGEKLLQNDFEEAVLNMEEETPYESLSISHSSGSSRTRAFLKVQDGCNQFCSYCIIPYVRGRVRSRDRSEALAEVARLAENSCKEVVLTGIHLSSYGVDIQDSNLGVHGEPGLLSLIQAIHEVKGIRRIRLSSLEPKIITEGFAKGLAALPKVCPHFHLSLQSGCDTTLKRMNRRYATGEYRQACDLLRSYYDHPAITTDVIVGFPGETEDEFEITQLFLQEIKFFEAHIFKYSIRQGTKAASMEGQVAEQVKQKRSSILIEDMKMAKKEFQNWYQGKEVEVLTEETIVIDGKTYMVGHTPEYMKVAFPLEEGILSNSFVKGRIIGSLNEDILKMSL